MIGLQTVISRVAAAALILLPVALSAQATMQGIVVNSITRAGIEGVSVRLYTSTGIRYEATTSGGGLFRIVGMQEGEYRSSFEKDGFEQPRDQDSHEAPSGIRVSGKDSLQVTLELLPWSTLRGRVVDPDGNPAANVPVEIWGPRTGDVGHQEIVSGSDGSFTFSKLLPGAFTLLAKPRAVKVAPNASSRLQTVATFYPSALERSQALPITVRGTGEESGYEIVLRRVPVHRVRGIVRDEKGQPVRGIRVETAQVADSFSRFRTTLAGVEFYLPPVPEFDLADDAVSTGADGVFEFPSVREGGWTIRAASEWQYQEDTRRDIQQTGQVRVLVSRGDLDDVEIRLASNFDMTAMIELEEGSKMEGISWAMMLLWPESGEVEPSSAKVNPDGTLAFERVYPGRYYLLPMAASAVGAYVSAVLFGGRNVLGEAIELTNPPPPMRIVFKGGAGAIRANITADAASILLVIPSNYQNGGVARSLKCAAGTPCEIAGLPPGDYYVAAFDHVDDARLSSVAYLSRLVGRAASVRVEQSALPVVDLRSNAWPD